MTVLDPDAGYVTLINTFEVEPERADALLASLSRATEEYISGVPGFVSANLHLSVDGRHVANYAQWRSQADLDAFMADPQAREHMVEAASIATAFRPIYYALKIAHGSGDRHGAGSAVTPAPRPIGPDFLALQVEDIDAARAFYTDVVGLTAVPQSPPGAVVFDTAPVPFGVRTPMGTLPANGRGEGVAIWFACDDADALHDRLVEHGTQILFAPKEGPFGRHFAFRDPFGYTITPHTASPS